MGSTLQGPLGEGPSLPWQNPVILQSLPHLPHKATHSSLHNLPKNILSSLLCSPFPVVSLVSYPVSILSEDQPVLTLSAPPFSSQQC